MYFNYKIKLRETFSFPEGKCVFDEEGLLIGISPNLSDMRTKKYRLFLTNLNYFCASISWNNYYTLTYESLRETYPSELETKSENLNIFRKMIKYPGSRLTKSFSLFYSGKLFESYHENGNTCLNFLALSYGFYAQILEHFGDVSYQHHNSLRHVIYHPCVSNEKHKRILRGMDTRSIKYRTYKNGYGAYLDLLDMESTRKFKNKLRIVRDISIELIKKELAKNKLWSNCLRKNS